MELLHLVHLGLEDYLSPVIYIVPQRFKIGNGVILASFLCNRHFRHVGQKPSVFRQKLSLKEAELTSRTLQI